jgi:hypothetical protein
LNWEPRGCSKMQLAEKRYFEWTSSLTQEAGTPSTASEYIIIYYITILLYFYHSSVLLAILFWLRHHGLFFAFTSLISPHFTIPSYRQKFKQDVPVKRSIHRWSDQSESMLQVHQEVFRGCCSSCDY